ncbi:MAG: lysophospholipase, partial [Sandaracinaceae bacterium]|nr:lysophospholipase [Sandaracinaceae bacterium]
HLRVHGASGPLLLLFHGNGEIVSDWDAAARSLVARGVRFAVLDYRGYGRSGGAPTMGRVLDDAWIVLAYAHALAGSDVIVMGRSLGSAPCWEVASAPCVRAVIVDSGFASVDAFARRRGLDPASLTQAERDALDPLPKIGEVTAPTLLLHGEDDAVIAHAEAERAHQALRTDKHLVTIPGRGHNDLSMHPAYWQALAPFLDAQR